MPNPVVPGGDPSQIPPDDDYFGQKWQPGGGGGYVGKPSGGDPGTGGTALDFLDNPILSLLSPDLYDPRRRRRGFGMPQARPMERAPLPSYEHGGMHMGGPAIVGENGPEMVMMPEGSYVVPNEALMRILGALFPEMLPHMANGGWFGPISKWAGAPPTTTPGKTTPADLIDRGGGQGAFDLMGSPQIAQMLRESVQAHSGARERAGQLGADLDSGGDPALRAYARTQARLNTQGQAADAEQNALLANAQGGQNFLRNLYLAQLGYSNNTGGSGWEAIAPILGTLIGAAKK